jgi:hypothetical protein
VRRVYRERSTYLHRHKQVDSPVKGFRDAVKAGRRRIYLQQKAQWLAVHSESELLAGGQVQRIEPRLPKAK